MTIRITDLATFATYIATSRDECRGIDKHVWDMCEITGDVITMGKIVGEIL